MKKYIENKYGDFEIDGEGEVDGDDDNATFTEVDGFCVNVADGCEDEV